MKNFERKYLAAIREQETALDREIVNRTKQRRMRREVHHSNYTPNGVRSLPNRRV